MTQCIRLGQSNKKLQKSEKMSRQFKRLLFGSSIRSTYERRIYWAYKTYSLGF